MDADGWNQHNVTSLSDSDHSAARSPDGDSIACVSGRDENYEIYVMDAGGGRQRRRFSSAQSIAAFASSASATSPCPTQ
jgi:Tol biopolymer transport system component